MNRARHVTSWMAGLLAVLVAVGATGSCLNGERQSVDVVLRFHPFVGPEPLVLNESRYPNPGGAGRFAVRDFQFFVSTIRLEGPTGAYVESDSYHLMRFDGEESGPVIVLRGVPRRDYERIELGIGVDRAANQSLVPRGDLDPNGRMAWTWEVGYKFVLFEGTLRRGDASVPLVYHVGFDESYTRIAAGMHGQLRKDQPASLDFRVDILRLFQGSATIDLAVLSSVKFDRADTALLARNFSAMLTPMWPDS